MIINAETSKNIFNKLTKMKEISKLNLDQGEMDNFFHTINIFNTLDKDENVVGNYVLSKYKILKQLEDLVLPAEVTISNSIKQVNLLSKDYKNYDAKKYFPMTKVDDQGEEYVTTNVEILNASDFNVVSDAIAGAFKKSAEFSDVETLKVTASIDDYVARETHKGLCAPRTDEYVPVELNINISKDKYLTEDATEQLMLWFENNVFRTLKKR